MTDEQNQTVMRAFATVVDAASPISMDEVFVAGVATKIRRRRRLQGRLQLVALVLVLSAAAVLAPLVVLAGGWLTGAAQWLARGAIDLATAPLGLMIVAALVFALVFPAGILVWAFRNR